MITRANLVDTMPGIPDPKIDLYVTKLNEALSEFQIVTLGRVAAFLGNVAVESAELRYMEEMTDGSAYEGRVDLGNTKRGDGPKFKGRGPLQLTGRGCYEDASEFLGVDLVSQPDLAASPEYGFRLAGWFWTIEASKRLGRTAAQHFGYRPIDLNKIADDDDLIGITLAINGGLSSHPVRMKYHDRAVRAMWRNAVVIMHEGCAL